MAKQEMACIVCPMSCHIEIELDDAHKVVSVTGNTCRRGEQYAVSELENPVRMVTSTVRLDGGLYRRLPVMTSEAVPKDRIKDVMAEINKARVCAPVKIGDIIIKNVCGLSADITASRSVEPTDGEDKAAGYSGHCQ